MPLPRRVGQLQLDLADQTLRVAGERIDVSPTEFRLLALLAADPGRVFSRRELMSTVSRRAGAWRDRTCDAHVKNLRPEDRAQPGQARAPGDCSRPGLRAARSVKEPVADLVRSGIVGSERVGRRNRYVVDRSAVPTQVPAGRTIGELIDLLGSSDPPALNA
jgi:hypothetical protein